MRVMIGRCLDDTGPFVCGPPKGLDPKLVHHITNILGIIMNYLCILFVVIGVTSVLANIAVTIKGNSRIVATDKEKILKLQAKDEGKDISESLEIQSIVNKAGDTLSGTVITGNTINLSALNIAPGIYTIISEINKNGETTSVRTKFAVVTDYSIDNVSVGLSNSKTGGKSNSKKVSTQNSFTHINNEGDSNEFISIYYTVKSLSKPHQSFIKFTHIESGSSVYFISTTSSASNKFEYESIISFNDEIESFEHLSGDYSISILVGDVYSTEAIEWIIGKINLNFPEKIVKDFPLYTRSLLHTSDNTLKALPEIIHKNNPPSVRASTFMALIFTGLSLVPLLSFLGYILYQNGANFKYLKSISNIIFVICVGTCLLVYAFYWLALPGFSFYDTIKYLCFLVPVTFFVASVALKDLSNSKKI